MVKVENESSILIGKVKILTPEQEQRLTEAIETDKVTTGNVKNLLRRLRTPGIRRGKEENGGRNW